MKKPLFKGYFDTEHRNQDPYPKIDIHFLGTDNVYHYLWSTNQYRRVKDALKRVYEQYNKGEVKTPSYLNVGLARNPLTEKTYRKLRRRYDRYHSARERLFPGKSCFTPEMQKQLPPDLKTSQIGAIEVHEFIHKPPQKYFLYIDEKKNIATTFNGFKLGTVTFGRPYRSSFGDTRVPISVYAINGYKYNGLYYKSSGNYARVKLSKRINAMNNPRNQEVAIDFMNQQPASGSNLLSSGQVLISFRTPIAVWSKDGVWVSEERYSHRTAVHISRLVNSLTAHKYKKTDKYIYAKHLFKDTTGLMCPVTVFVLWEYK